jgi:Kef-type K+ transport system membrane component KefB
VDTSHGDVVARIVLALAVLLASGKVAGEIAVRLRQPAVLGELVAGIVLGNLGLHAIDWIKTDEIVEVFANLGVLILLFQIGVEATVGQMLQVGVSSFLVAALGVIVPFALGWGAGALLLPGASTYVHAFLGATLSATSVGITARALQDLGASKRMEARIILGAAVVDDVLGLMILGVVSGAIVSAGRGEPLSLAAVARTALAAAIFLFGAIAIGRTAVSRLFAWAARLQTSGVLLSLSLICCFVMAWLASLVGLAPIIGAFAAGLILEDAHFHDFVARGERSVEDLLRPLTDFLVPVFFVLMGLRTDLRAFGQPGMLGLAAAITVAAIVGKQACALGVVTRGVDRLTVGIGMIPRGEVGLIFANVGLGLALHGEPIMNREIFSAVVGMVVVTTLITPPALKWSLNRASAARHASG